MNRPRDAASVHHRLVQAVSLHEKGQFDQALSVYQALLCEQPDLADALHLSGLALTRLGLPDRGMASIGRALRVQPCSTYAVSLGSVLCEQKRFAEAERIIAQALGTDADNAEGHHQRANALSGLGRVGDAKTAYRAAVALAPAFVLAHLNLGTALERMDQPAQAEACYRRAIRLHPSHPMAHYNLGTALHAQERLEEAEAAYRIAARLRPNHPGTRYNLGLLCQDLGWHIAAEKAYRAAIRLQPDHADSHWNLALTLLTRGIYAEGWEEYEWRWLTRDFLHGYTRYSHPRWNGEPLTGKTILIHAEQGIGDTLQFIRYVPDLARLGGRVILTLPRSLERLTATLPGVTVRLFDGDLVPDVDLHCPLLSLPRVFGTQAETIPGAAVPYLHPDPALAATWAQRLGPQRGRLRVGLVWAGNPAYRKDRARSPGLEALRPLFAVEGVEFVILQQGQGREELGRVSPLPPLLTDPGGGITDFADSAAIMAGLDLVISSCTAPAHLAGALGRPVWVALQAVPDWRWGLKGGETPWYPTMRLFRQPDRGDWNGVFTPMAAELATLAALAHDNGGIAAA